jgi:hypothetical protein
MFRRFNDYTVILTKPWNDPADEISTIWMLEDLLQESGGIKREFGKRSEVLPMEFWEEFYVDVRGWEGFGKMMEDFMTLERGPILIFYSGENVTQRVKDCIGPTRYRDNLGKGTIRETFGDPNSPEWRNILHAPKPEEVVQNLMVLKEHGLFR